MPDTDDLSAMAINALEELNEPLDMLGHRWAESRNRPRPEQLTLDRWDDLLELWIRNKKLPLVLRNGGKRGQRIRAANGREIVFGDNSPANWSLGLALAGVVPDIRLWNSDNIAEHVPLSFLSRGAAAKRDLNKAGWKICHINAVSDRKRDKIQERPVDRVIDAFCRFLSPRNMFLVPKTIFGVGEIPAVVDAVAMFERSFNADK